jgi:hypothetical protein
VRPLLPFFFTMVLLLLLLLLLFTCTTEHHQNSRWPLITPKLNGFFEVGCARAKASIMPACAEAHRPLL